MQQSAARAGSLRFDLKFVGERIQNKLERRVKTFVYI
jgi:hypothetical protein